MRRFAVVAAAFVASAAPAADARPAGGGCLERGVRTAFAAYVAAFNRGDLMRLDGLFAREPDFEWYSSGAPGPRLRGASADRSTLLAYFRARHVRRDRLRLLRWSFNGTDGVIAHFDVRLERAARDYRAGAPFRISAKGAARCRGNGGPRFVVMSLGAP